MHQKPAAQPSRTCHHASVYQLVMREGIGINARRLHALKHLQRCAHVPTFYAALQHRAGLGAIERQSARVCLLRAWPV